MPVTENTNEPTKILDATTGSSDEFDSLDNLLTYRFTVSGTPSANIKVFIKKQTVDSKIMYVKASCATWNSASLVLEAKTKHTDDDFSSTGTDDTIVEDDVRIFDY
jgi:hypothetical protein